MTEPDQDPDQDNNEPHFDPQPAEAEFVRAGQTGGTSADNGDALASRRAARVGRFP